MIDHDMITLEAARDVKVFAKLSPLRAERHEFDFQAGASLLEILDQVRIDLNCKTLGGHWHIAVDGESVDRSWWPHIRVKSGRTVVVTRVPAIRALKKIAAIAVSIIALVVAPFIAAPLIAALGLGGVAAGIVTGVIAAGLTVVGTLAVNALFPTSVMQGQAAISQQDKDITKPIYSIGGAQNTAAAFSAIPVVFGTHRMSPLYAAQPYTEIAGDEQYLRLLFAVGYGPISMSDLKIGETALASFEGLSYEIVENHLVDAQTLFTQPVYEEQLSVDLSPADVWASRTTADNIDEFSVDVGFPAGVYKFLTSNGQRENYTVNVAVQHRLVGDVSWTSSGTITVTANSSQPVRRTLRVTVSRGQYEVRVQKSSADYVGTDTVSESVGWSALRGRRLVSIVNFTKPLTMISMRIKATNELAGVVNTFNLIASTKILSWNGSSWVAGQTTSNPADHFRHVLQSNANARALDDIQIDLVSLQNWHDYCTTAGFTFNSVRSEVVSVYDTLRDIAAAGRGAVTLRDGKWGVIWDRADDTIVQHFTPRNSSDFQSARAFADLPHAFRVSFINANNNWQNDERIVYDDGYTVANATKFEGLDFTGVTDPDLIWKHGRYHIAQLRLQREVYTLETDFENLVCTRGDRVRVNHDVVLWGAGAGRVKSFTSSPDTVTIDDTFAMVTGTTYAIRFRLNDGTAIVRTIAGVTGDFSTFTFSDSGSLPAVGDLAMFGEQSFESVVLRVKGVTPGADLTAQIELVDDAPGILEADTGTIPEFQTGITARVDYSSYKPRFITAVESVQSVSPPLSYVDVSWSPPEGENPRQYIVQYAVTGTGLWSKAKTFQGETGVLTDLESGSYDVRVRAVFWNNQLSGWETLHFTAGIFDRAPADVTGFNIAVSGDNARLTWDVSADLIISHYEIRFSPVTSGATWATSSVLRLSVTGTSVDVAALVGTYLIKAVSYRPIYSDNAVLITSTINALTSFNVVETVTEQPDFAGTFDNTYRSGVQVRLALQGDMFTLTDFFDVSDYFLEGGGYYSSGYYYFESLLDLGQVYTSRVTATINASGEKSSVDIFVLTNFFSPSDFFWATDESLWNVTIEAATTDDDPNAEPTWSAWSELIVEDLSARGYKFRALLGSGQYDVTPVVTGLSVSVDMPDRVIAGDDLVVTVAGRAISFSPPYRVLQGVSVAAQDLQTGDYYEITSKTRSGFSIIFKNSSNAAVERTFDYVAKGYGIEQ